MRQAYDYWQDQPDSALEHCAARGPASDDAPSPTSGSRRPPTAQEEASTTTQPSSRYYPLRYQSKSRYRNARCSHSPRLSHTPGVRGDSWHPRPHTDGPCAPRYPVVGSHGSATPLLGGRATDRSGGGFTHKVQVVSPGRRPLATTRRNHLNGERTPAVRPASLGARKSSTVRRRRLSQPLSGCPRAVRRGDQRSIGCGLVASASGALGATPRRREAAHRVVKERLARVRLTAQDERCKARYQAAERQGTLR